MTAPAHAPATSREIADPVRVLLVLGGPRLGKAALLEALQRLAGVGWRGDVVSWRALDDELRAAVHATGGEVVLLPGAVPPPKLSSHGASRSGGGGSNEGPRLVRAVRWRWRKARRALEPRITAQLDRLPDSPATTALRKAGLAVPPSVGISRRLLTSVDAVRLAKECDVAVAVDRDANLAVWRIARRRHDVTVRSGLVALLRLVDAR